MGEDLIGAVLDGRYQVVERVAEGAMGVVYRGERIKLGRAVAIKFLHAWNAEDAAARKRFEVEARAMARLEHPHCAAVIDVGEYEGAPYVVMDFVRGTNLRDILDDGRLEPARATEIAKQVLSGLAHAHDLGIVHRDIKPANVMLSEKTGLGEVVKILDFGLARLRGSTGSLTVGIAIGTPSYMSPEQINSGEIDSRTDLYALGIFLFEMLTGEKPFVDDDPIEVLRMHREKPPPRLADLAPGIDFGALEDVVARALAKRPDDRFATAAEFSAAIDAAMGTGASAKATRSSPDALAGVPMAARGAASASAPAPAPAGPGTLPLPMPAPGSGSRLAPAPPRPPSTRGMDPARRRLIVGAAAVAVGLAAIGIIAAVASRTGGGPAPASDAAPAIVAPAIDAGDPSADVLARARAMSDGGDVDGALRLLDAAHRMYPERAAIPYEMGRLYFARLWWSDGIHAYRAAIHADPSLRADPELIKTVLRGFNTTPDTDAGMAAFLHDDIGDAARPYLEETATSHPSAKIRARASALLGRFR